MFFFCNCSHLEQIRDFFLLQTVKQNKTEAKLGITEALSLRKPAVQTAVPIVYESLNAKMPIFSFSFLLCPQILIVWSFKQGFVQCERSVLRSPILILLSK